MIRTFAGQRWRRQEPSSTLLGETWAPVDVHGQTIKRNGHAVVLVVKDGRHWTILAAGSGLSPIRLLPNLGGRPRTLEEALAWAALVAREANR